MLARPGIGPVTLTLVVVSVLVGLLPSGADAALCYIGCRSQDFIVDLGCAFGKSQRECSGQCQKLDGYINGVRFEQYQCLQGECDALVGESQQVKIGLDNYSYLVSASNCCSENLCNAGQRTHGGGSSVLAMAMALAAILSTWAWGSK